MLEITSLIGRIHPINSGSTDRSKAYREQLENKEFEFSLNLWNVMNKYLFNYVDSVTVKPFV